MNTYVVTPGDSQADRSTVFRLARHLPAFSEHRYAKYYSNHPLGTPRFAFLRHGPGQEAVGMAALFPAAVRINGERVACGIAGDLALDPAHRTLGPALLLGTSLLDLLPQSEFRFVYALPNPAAEPVFRRLRYTELGRMTRFVKLFKTEFAVQALLTRPTFAKGFSKLLDPLVSAIARERWRRRDVSLQFTWGQGSTHDSTLSGTPCSADPGLWASARRRCSTGSTKPENRPGSFACSALRRENRFAVTPSHRIGWASAMCSTSLSIAGLSSMSC